MLGNHPIVAKNVDGVARIISVGRLSKPKDSEAATQQSLDAIRRENERLLKSFHSGPTAIRYLAEQISGMVAERATMTELWELVASGEWDVIIAEDLSRVFRNPVFQLKFLQDCVDAGIRAICFADNIDTADEGWETAALIAAVRHGLAIPDTRRRIKRTATDSFKRGGMVLRTKAFYSKVSREDAAAGTFGPKGLRIRKLTDLTWAVDEIRRRLHAGESPRFIIAWLIAEGVPCGEYVKSGRWSLKNLRELLQDPILHGTRTFRDVVHKQIFKTGNYQRDKNATPDSEYVPELAFMTRDEQEAMLATVGWSIDWGGVKPAERPHPRKGISRYESHWPAQSTTCSVCGDKMFAYGMYLRCRNSFAHLGGSCWNHCQAPIAPLRAALVNWLVAQCDASPAFREVLLDAAKRQLQQQRSSRAFQRDALGAKAKDLEGQERNLRRSIRIAEEIAEEDLKALVADLVAVTSELREVRHNAEHADAPATSLADIGDDEILPHLAAVLVHLLGTSFGMAEVMRRFVPQCMIVPVQSLDPGQVYPRAKLLVRGDVGDYDQLEELVVDLFEPPVYIRLMPEVLKLRAATPRPTLKQLGALLGTSYMSIKRSIGYAKLMEELGANEPFRELREKPLNAPRWRDAS